jgi:hypothetical protein
VLACGLSVAGRTVIAILAGVVLSFGYLVLRQVLQLLLQVMRGERSKEIEILVLRHQSGAGARRRSLRSVRRCLQLDLRAGARSC